MALLKFADHHEGRRSAWSTSSDRSYQVQVQLDCDRVDGPATVLSYLVAKGITNGSTYRYPVDPAKTATETDAGCFVNGVSLEQQGFNGQIAYWLATLTYEPVAPSENGFDPSSLGGPSNPLQIPPEITWSFTKYQIGQVQDVSDPPKPYVNKALDPLIDVPPADSSRPVLTYVRNELTYNISLATTYQDKVNSLVWNGFAPRTVKIQQISGKKNYSTDSSPNTYWTVTYEFEVKPDTWTLKMANVGLTEIKALGDPANPADHKPIMLNNKVPASTPMPLNEQGRYAPGTTLLLDFEQYAAVDFTPLNITGILS